MFGYVSGFLQIETEGIRSRSLALKKSCNTPQLPFLCNVESITKTKLCIPPAKRKIKLICHSRAKRKTNVSQLERVM